MSSGGKLISGCRVPLEWKEQFEQLAKASDRKPADLAREAFAAYLGVEADSSAITDIRQLVEGVGAIEEKFLGLNQLTS